MKKLLLFLFFISSVAGLSQTGITVKKGKAIRKLISPDSLAKKIQDLKDSVAISIQISDSSGASENMSRNFDGILQWQKEQRVKQKRAAWIRISIGILLLGVLVIGLRRRKK
jgi:hypothetical protein